MISADEEMIGLKFKKEEDFIYCFNLLEKERPNMFFGLPGRQCAIIPAKELPWLAERFEGKVDYKTISVVSAGAEEIAELRASTLKILKSILIEPRRKIGETEFLKGGK